MNRSKKLLFFCLVGLIIFSCNKESKNTDKKTEIKKKTESVQASSGKPSDIDGQYILETKPSEILWTGSKPAGKHNGKLKIKSGEFIFENGSLTAGKFIIDMSSITVLDLDGEEKKDLENHLKGNIPGREDHFFNVNRYPEALFIIKTADKRKNIYSIYGDLTIKGISNPIKFNANIETSQELNKIKLSSGYFGIDRTKWGIEYMSRSVFDDLKERFIYDEIGLKVILEAVKSN